VGVLRLVALIRVVAAGIHRRRPAETARAAVAALAAKTARAAVATRAARAAVRRQRGSAKSGRPVWRRLLRLRRVGVLGIVDRRRRIHRRVLVLLPGVGLAWLIAARL